MLSKLWVGLMFTTTVLARPTTAWATFGWRRIVVRRQVPIPAVTPTCFSSAIANPTDEWKGSSHSSSGFVDHILLDAAQAPLSVTDAVQRILTDRKKQNLAVTELNATELLHLGSVWFLPANAPRDPALGGKPVRLDQTAPALQAGDYLRVHHHPRRFPHAHRYDWSKSIHDTSGDKPGVIVAEDTDKGWLVIRKPSMVPVHMTVDNCRENVADCLKQARAWQSPAADARDVYITTPQRLDQNTSGLVVVATHKPFAAYFASLLRSKTARQLSGDGDDRNHESLGSVHKLYRCLVCLQSPPVVNATTSTWSAHHAADFLRDFQRESKVLRHYLEPSIRAPKRFVEHPPDDSQWPECLLKIVKVGNVCELVGSPAGQDLAEALWQDASGQAKRIPPQAKAVVEVEIELLTGRTHQIRGQLSTLGFPLVGDAQYGGAVPRNPTNEQFYIGTEQLALQCCELAFRDPDREGDILVRSQRWNRFRLESAWWSPFLELFHSTLDATPAILDPPEDCTESSSRISETSQEARPDRLPPRVSLSPGKNKYVLIRATHPNDKVVQWFVVSAAPSECGGPYHGNVAQDPREWIEAAGYTVEVTGGGRIDYQPESSTAKVYGFSYGFGKGDHIVAARLIQEVLGKSLRVTYDLSDDLY
jgi:23S rRNA-/tRNA-specific pseudouridylate synthase